MTARVARAIAQAEMRFGTVRESRSYEESFARLLDSRLFLPNSPTLMNAGTSSGQLSACFVLPVHDSLEEIFDALRSMALIQRTGGGTGFSFSELRPGGDPIVSTGGEASGPLSFLRVFNCATEEVKQGGRRRGANIGILRVDHPDILDFIRVKTDGTSLRNFNLSVSISDDFMTAVRNRADFALVNPRTHATTAKVRAAEIFDAIVDAIWTCGDPGLSFRDAINRANPLPELGEIEATNPCGEVPLLPFESCTLGSIDLARFVDQNSGPPQINWPELRRTIHLAVRFLDDAIEVNRFPISAVETITRANRKIGLGVMGFAAMLIRLGVSYDSDEAVHLASHVARFIEQHAIAASAELSEQRGVFPNWQHSIDRHWGLRLRNATRTAIAPTGTLSIIAGTTPSIEPLFALAYRRTGILGGQTMTEVNPAFVDYAERHGLESAIPQVLERGTLTGVNVPEDVRSLFATALEIPIDRQLQIQQAFQRFTDNAVSKTINLQSEATREAIEHAIWRAWELGLKGVTLFRFGSRSSQVIELGTGTRCEADRCV